MRNYMSTEFWKSVEVNPLDHKPIAGIQPYHIGFQSFRRVDAAERERMRQEDAARRERRNNRD